MSCLHIITHSNIHQPIRSSRTPDIQWQQDPSNVKKVYRKRNEIQTNVGTAIGVSNNAGPINRTQRYIAGRMVIEMGKRLLILSVAKKR